MYYNTITGKNFLNDDSVFVVVIAVVAGGDPFLAHTNFFLLHQVSLQQYAFEMLKIQFL